MKTVVLWLALASAAIAQTIIPLESMSTLPPLPDGVHADAYELPHELWRDDGVGIEQIWWMYFNEGPGHLIVDQFAMIRPQDGVVTTNFIGVSRFRSQGALAFHTPVNGLLNPDDPFFVAYHEQPYSLTRLEFTAFYEDGTRATATTGVIPEPGAGAMMALACLFFVGCCRVHVTVDQVEPAPIVDVQAEVGFAE